jgi:hypothetical protein
MLPFVVSKTTTGNSFLVVCAPAAPAIRAAKAAAATSCFIEWILRVGKMTATARRPAVLVNVGDRGYRVKAAVGGAVGVLTAPRAATTN